MKLSDGIVLVKFENSIPALLAFGTLQVLESSFLQKFSSVSSEFQKLQR